MSTAIELDLVVDLNTIDETGLPWAFIDDAPDPRRITPGSYIIVGSGQVRAVALVVQVENGIVNVLPCPGSVMANARLLPEGRF